MSDVQDDELREAEKGVPVEEAAPPSSEAASEPKPSSTSRRNKLWIAGLILLVISAIVGLTVGLVVRSERQKNEISGSSLTGSGNNNETPSPSLAQPPEPTTAIPPSAIPPSDTPSEPVTIPPTVDTTSPPTTPSPVGEEMLYYRSTAGIFNVTLPLFSSSAVLGYSDKSELEKDLTEAIKFKVNQIVEQSNLYYGRPIDDVGTEEGVEPEFGADTAAGDSPASAPTSPIAGDVDDFDTNTVEDSIDEGDLLKTNGVHAFAGYGQYVLVWDVKTGEQITNITLPSISYDGGDKPPIIEPYVITNPQDGDFGISDSTAGDGGGRKKRNLQSDSTAGDGGRNKRKLQFVDEYYYWPVTPSVQSLLLHEDRLVVIANGYGQMERSKLLDYEPVLYDAFSTNVRIYDISQLGATGEVTLVKEAHIHGNFDSIRADGSKVHIVTFSGLNTWNGLEQELNRYNPQFQDLDYEAYYEAARQLAEDELIPKFVGRLIQDLSFNGEPANIARVSMWQKHLSNDSELEDRVWESGVINSFAQVSSFDMLDASDNLSYTMSGALMPTGWGHTYATDKMLVIAGQGWDWIADMNGSRQTTYLHGFALLENGEATPAAVGSLDGSVLNEYSVDIVDNYMRVAVTIRNDFWVFAMDDEDDSALRTENYIVVLEIPDGTGTNVADAVMKEVGRSENLGEDGEVFTSVRFSDEFAFAITFEQVGPRKSFHSVASYNTLILFFPHCRLILST